ncbi:hypothetical protein QG37_04668 [Candidozyma auris]|nr:hypothetical protein QG37_04668 [[Candida] auris]
MVSGKLVVAHDKTSRRTKKGGIEEGVKKAGKNAGKRLDLREGGDLRYF